MVTEPLNCDIVISLLPRYYEARQTGKELEVVLELVAAHLADCANDCPEQLAALTLLLDAEQSGQLISPPVIPEMALPFVEQPQRSWEISRERSEEALVSVLIRVSADFMRMLFDDNTPALQTRTHGKPADTLLVQDVIDEESGESITVWLQTRKIAVGEAIRVVRTELSQSDQNHKRQVALQFGGNSFSATLDENGVCEFYLTEQQWQMLTENQQIDLLIRLEP